MSASARRARSGAAALVLVAGLLAACGSNDSPSVSVEDVTGGQPPKAGEVKADVLKGTSVTFVGYGGEVQKSQVATLRGFEKSGATIEQDSPTDPAKLQAQVKSGQVSWDMVDVGDSWAAANCGTLLEKLDDRIIDRSVLPKELQGTECSVPFVGTGYVLGYDPKKFGDDGPKDWADFFDTEKFPGKRAVNSNDPTTMIEAALLADGVAPGELYPLDFDRAYKKLDTIKKDLVFWSSGAESQQMVEGGQASMAMLWSGRALNAAQNGTEWNTAKKNPMLTYDVYVVPKGSKNSVAAQALINYAIGDDLQARITEKTGYPAANLNKEPKLTPLVAKFQVNKAPYTDPIYVDAEFWADNLAEQTDRWTTWING